MRAPLYKFEYVKPQQLGKSFHELHCDCAWQTNNWCGMKVGTYCQQILEGDSELPATNIE